MNILLSFIFLLANVVAIQTVQVNQPTKNNIKFPCVEAAKFQGLSGFSESLEPSYNFGAIEPYYVFFKASTMGSLMRCHAYLSFNGYNYTIMKYHFDIQWI